jgi:hypothetical protein
MDFDNDYWNAMDKEPKYSLKATELGIAHGMGDVSKGLKANIFAGASQVELGFMGRGKGSRSQPTGVTPESYGRQEREDMRQLAKINEVKLTTHASPNAGSFSGFGERGFKEENKEAALHEVKRAIEFAADTAGGGPVVVHTSEFPRSIEKEYGKEGFRAFEEEPEKRIYYLVNKKTGEITGGVREDQEIWEPVEKKDKYGNVIFQKTPEGEDRKERFTGKKIPEYELDEHGDIEIKKVKFSDFRDDLKEEEKKDAPKMFAKKMRVHEIEQSLGQAEEYEMMYKQSLEQRKKILDSIEIYRNMKKSNDPIYRENQKQVIKNRIPFMPDEVVDMEDYLKESLRETEKRMAYGQETAIGARRRAHQIQEDVNNLQPIEKYGLKESSKTMARAGIYAYDKEKAQKLKKPLFIAPENVFPEGGYGGHPKELKKLVLESRKEMADRLHEERKIPKHQAQKIAEDHIKATFDIGHAYTWKKFFTGTDKQFKSWLNKQVKDLAKEGIIGHVHISDNFGYYDEHLTPGEGDVPLKDFVKELKEQGYEGDFIVEPGGQPEGQTFKALTGAWTNFTSPMYRIDTHSRSWTDIEGTYFGRTGSPSYVVGDYSPSKDWTLWSETQLE